MKEYTLDSLGVPRGSGRAFTMDAAGIASGNAFLVSELEKLDPLLREPLTSTTYPRDIEIQSGGGWIESTSAMNVDYAVSGGQSDAVGGNQNSIRTIQANVDKDIFKVFPYEIAMKVKFTDMQRGQVTGRGLEAMYDDGIRLDWDKYLDLNTYVGQVKYGTTGLINNPTVIAASVAMNKAGTSTLWKDKDADEILYDVNMILNDGWAASNYDRRAMPNHILIPPAKYIYIKTTKVSAAADKTILKFLLENNAMAEEGVDLFIGECRFCIGAGTGGTDRMAAYRNERRFVGMDVPVALTRVMTQPNAGNATYDSLYVGNVGQVKVHYNQPFRYADGI